MISSSSQRYECKLSSTALAVAVNELNEPEDNTERLSAIDDLKTAFHNKNPDTKLVNESDLFLLRFLRAKKFDIERAVDVLTQYHKRHEIWPEAVDKLENKQISLKPLLDSDLVAVLDGKAKDGSSVIVVYPGKNDTPMPDFFVLALLSVEQLLEDEEFQIFGLTAIEDMTYFGTNMMKYMGPSLARKALGIIQNCMPIRFRSINIINEPTIFSVVWSIVSPFLKEKMKQRFRVHGSSYENVHEIVDPNILPEVYGGSGKPLDFVLWKETLFGEDTPL